MFMLIKIQDFGAHTNYCELALRELGYREVFPHCGASSEINIRGKHIYPLVTGTFGAVDFLHSVLGEATDHFTQTEIDEMNVSFLIKLQLSRLRWLTFLPRLLSSRPKKVRQQAAAAREDCLVLEVVLTLQVSYLRFPAWVVDLQKTLEIYNEAPRLKSTRILPGQMSILISTLHLEALVAQQGPGCLE